MLYMYDCRSPLPGASIWCYICTTVGVHYQERPSGAIYVRLSGVHCQERPSGAIYMYDCRSPLLGASIWCYICTTVGVHYQERPSGAIYVRL